METKAKARLANHRFEIGDKVIIKDSATPEVSFYKGCRGIIEAKRLNNLGHTEYKVRLTKPSAAFTRFYKEHLWRKKPVSVFCRFGHLKHDKGHSTLSGIMPSAETRAKVMQKLHRLAKKAENTLVAVNAAITTYQKTKKKTASTKSKRK